MTADELVEVIHKEASADVIKKYLKFLDGSDGEDPKWNLFKKIYRDLELSDQSDLIDVLRFAQSDSISSILSILDNQTFPNVQKEDLVLLHGEEKINGDLTDIYLEKEEEGWDSH